MAIIVEHKVSHELFVLIGGGFGAFKSSYQNGWGVEQIEEGTIPMVSVCDREGNIGWMKSDQIKIVNIDGMDISELTDLGNFDRAGT